MIPPDPPNQDIFPRDCCLECQFFQVEAMPAFHFLSFPTYSNPSSVHGKLRLIKAQLKILVFLGLQAAITPDEITRHLNPSVLLPVAADRGVSISVAVGYKTAISNK